MASIIARAPGKVNRILRVGAPTDDGYHPLVTVFEAVSLYEYVHVEEMPGNVDDVVTVCYLNQSEDPEATHIAAAIHDVDHLAMRALRALRPPSTPAVRITVHKSIPTAGGMAGGSADAAATLVAVNALWDLGLGSDELQQIGRPLGADVPACIAGGVTLGVGRGDVLESIDDNVDHHWVLAFSYQGLSTPAVFAQFDRLNLARDLPRKHDIDLQYLTNDLAAAALSLRPELEEVGNAALEAGAQQWIVSGSGPTIAALVSDEATAGRVRATWELMPNVRGTCSVRGPVIGAEVCEKLPLWARRCA